MAGSTVAHFHPQRGGLKAIGGVGEKRLGQRELVTSSVRRHDAETARMCLMRHARMRTLRGSWIRLWRLLPEGADPRLPCLGKSYVSTQSHRDDYDISSCDCSA